MKPTDDLTPEQLETQKQAGWGLYRDGLTPVERARGLFAIIEAHFCRNPEAPSLAAYAAHWLWATEGTTDAWGRAYDREVLAQLTARYPRPSGSPRIRRDESDWSPVPLSPY